MKNITLQKHDSNFSFLIRWAYLEKSENEKKEKERECRSFLIEYPETVQEVLDTLYGRAFAN